MKAKLCRVCKKQFTPFQTTQVACSIDCALKLKDMKIDKKAEKLLKAQEMAYDQETRNRKVKLKTKSEWAKEAQAAFNKYIRLRDIKEPCICCGAVGDYAWDAGHYLTVAARPELRFNEWNVHKQRSRPCNKDLSGNHIEYRKRLIDKIGEEKVLWLEGPHERHSWTVEELKAIKDKYNKLCKEMEKNARLSQTA